MYDPIAATRCDPPLYMPQGTQGPAVTPVLRFLASWALERRFDTPRLIVNEFFSDEAKLYLEKYQAENGLPTTGVVDAPTIKRMREQGFDYVERLKAQGSDPNLQKLTRFFGRKGAAIWWGPGIEPTNQPEAAKARLRATWPAK